MTVLDARLLAELAAECDLDGASACPAGPAPVPSDPAPEALALAMPGELRYVHRSLARRLDPGLVLPGARSVVSVCLAYAGTHPGREALSPGHGAVSRFAWCADYHGPVGERVKRFAALLSERYGIRARAYVDTGPVYEKAWAAAAGLGFIGKSTLLVTPRFGTFVFLGAIVTDAPCESPRVLVEPGCGDCDACRRACPTGALDRPYVLDASRCLAHLTVSAREPVPGPLASRLDGWLYGCDACQDACPRNRRAERPGRPEFAPLAGISAPALDAVESLDEAGFRAAFGTTPIRRRGLEGLRATARLLASGERTRAGL